MTRFAFGMGIAIVNHWKLIKKYYNPEFVIDNDEKKWNSFDSYTHLLCVSPEKIREYEQAEVLITIGDPYIVEKVKAQLDEMNINYKVLMDEIQKWSAEEILPDHLMPIKNGRKKILLFNTPEHDNVGDHLISLSELQFLNERFSDYEIYEVTDIEYIWFHSEIKRHVSSDDLILITGGGFLGSLWLYNGEDNVRSILNEYSQNRIIILPQTVYFENNDRGKKECEKTIIEYSKHPNLTLCVREAASYSFFLSAMKSDAKIYLFPDMALMYTLKCRSFVRKEKVLLCLRNDKERILDDKEYDRILIKLADLEWEIEKTSMHSGEFTGIVGRTGQVETKLQEIGSSSLVVTDTLHCMILATITGTPCIAFDNLSGKVKNVYDWVKNLPYIQLCEGINEFEEILQSIKSVNGEYRREMFLDYMEKLESVIRGE